MRRLAAILAVFACVAAAARAQTSDKPEAVAPYAATLSNVVDAMLKLAEVGPNDYVVDLGSGDGRIVIAAVKEFGAARGVGHGQQYPPGQEPNQKNPKPRNANTTG